MVLEGLSLRTAVNEAQALRRGMTWWAFIRRAKTPELPVVLLEDVGALLGLAIALVCVLLAVWTGDNRFDAVGSLLIGILLGVIAVILGIEMKSLLIGESASLRQRRAIKEAIESHPKLISLIHLRTQHLGPEELLVGAKVALDPEQPLYEVAEIINEIEVRVRAKVPMARVIYIEPDVMRQESTPESDSRNPGPDDDVG